MSQPESTPGFIFFSPAMEPNAGAQVDIALVSLTARVADTYRIPPSQAKNVTRPFLLGPAPSTPSGRAWPPDFSASYEPQLNNTEYGLMSNKSGSAVRGELFNTSTLELTVVLV